MKTTLGDKESGSYALIFRSYELFDYGSNFILSKNKEKLILLPVLY